jgi:hypothetical protein
MSSSSLVASTTLTSAYPSSVASPLGGCDAETISVSGAAVTSVMLLASVHPTSTTRTAVPESFHSERRS